MSRKSIVVLIGAVLLLFAVTARAWTQKGWWLIDGFGPVGLVLIEPLSALAQCGRYVYATHGPGVDPTGPIYRLDTHGNVVHLGNAAATFAIAGYREYNADQIIALAKDKSYVSQYVGDNGWMKIGGPAAMIYAGRHGIFAINPETGDINEYSGTPMVWGKVGGPGKKFVVTISDLFGLSPDGGGVFRHIADENWEQIGGAAADIYGGGFNLFATNPESGTIWQLAPHDKRGQVGGPGRAFAVDGGGDLYGLSVDGRVVLEYTGVPGVWDRLSTAGLPDGTVFDTIFVGGCDIVLGREESTGLLWQYCEGTDCF